jgi:hypothetical protein
MRSQAQRAAMHAAAAGHSTLGIPKGVAKEFVASDRPGKLPEHVKASRVKEIEDHPALRDKSHPRHKAAVAERQRLLKG